MHTTRSAQRSVIGSIAFSVLFAVLFAAHAGDSPSSDQSEQATIPVSIRGVLLDCDGKPVDEGFLMCKGNPQLNALTGIDGQFRIEGMAFEMPDVLLASWAGCDVSQTPLEKPTETDLKIKLQRGDPQFIQIEMGMSLKIRWAPFYAAQRPLTEVQRKCIHACDEFVDGPGAAIIRKMLAGEKLSDAEARYEYVLACEIRNRTLSLHDSRETLMYTTYRDTDKSAEVKYFERIDKEFERVSLKALSRARLNAEDVHALRLHSATAGASGFDQTSIDLFQKLHLGSVPIETGKPIGFDVPFLCSSPLWTSPQWNNYTSLSATTILRLEGLWTYLDCYWKWEMRGKNTLVMSPPEGWKKRYWQDSYKVTSINDLVRKGDGKPVYIVCSNFEDGTHPGFYTRQVEYLRRAYAGVADVYHSSQTSGTAFYDMYLDECTYYGPNPKSDPSAGLDYARWEDDNYTPWRHARTDKLCAMSYPWASGEMLLDLPRGSSFIDNRVSVHHNLIFDRSGNISIPFPSGDWSIIFTKFFNGNAYLSYLRDGGESYMLALIHEQILRALINNSGRYDANIFENVLVQYPQTIHAKDDVFVVKSVDKEKHVVHASWLSPGPPQSRDCFGSGPRYEGTDPKGEYVLKVDEGTRYEVRTVDGKPAWTFSNVTASSIAYKIGGLDDFKPGQRFFATLRMPEPIAEDVSLANLIKNVKRARPPYFDMAPYDGKELQAERLINYRHINYYGGGNHDFMPLYGRVTAKDGDVITVNIKQDEVKEMWGYRFWKEEESKGRSATGVAQLFWPIIKRWADGGDDDRTYRFKLDRAADIYRNGLGAEGKDVQVGDYVFVEYEIWWENQKLQHEIIYPERVQASAPIKAGEHSDNAAK